jgi:hypothetical protein
MTIQTPDNSFEIADQKIDNLLKRLAAKNVCPCCTARALAFHAACAAERKLGSAQAIEMCSSTSSPLCASTTYHRPTVPPRRQRIKRELGD